MVKIGMQQDRVGMGVIGRSRGMFTPRESPEQTLGTAGGQKGKCSGETLLKAHLARIESQAWVVGRLGHVFSA